MASLKSISITVGEQITVEQLTELSIVMRISRYDHVTSDQVTTEHRRSPRVRSTPEWYGNPVLEVMLLDHD